MKELKFVDVGEGITEGHVQKWLVHDGDSVKEDQSIAQIETDKAVVNLPAPISGVVKIVAKEDSIVHVGDTICFVGTAAELKGAAPQQSAAAPKAQQQPAKQIQAAQPATKSTEIIATPAVRKLARDLNVDLKTITGTGPQGRIVENDVRGRAGQSAKQAAPAMKYSEVLEEKHDEEIAREPMSMTRKAIARNMEESWKIPRATHMDLINATELWNLVGKEKPKLKEMDIHLTFLPFIIKALVQALKENPHFNASYDHEKQEIIVKKYYNIGLAAESDDGLKVIVVKGADKKSISQIAKDIQNLGKKVKDKTITIEEMKDTSITITNIGSLGGGFLAVPMINPPDVAIIGILSMRDWQFFDNGKPVAGKVMPFTITFDHRVVDGAEAVKLGNALIKYLEDPDFLEML
ncbi:MAG TPA: dihydrolipoamide acetyltransferase family protein [Candidatus Acidoferrum sp.]|nr:dihydrolipoamide acetyltransferase family protein [Candidatus Acidoferrum sp.]